MLIFHSFLYVYQRVPGNLVSVYPVYTWSGFKVQRFPSYMDRWDLWPKWWTLHCSCRFSPQFASLNPFPIKSRTPIPSKMHLGGLFEKSKASEPSFPVCEQSKHLTFCELLTYVVAWNPPEPSNLDWRTSNLVTRAKDQNSRSHSGAISMVLLQWLDVAAMKNCPSMGLPNHEALCFCGGVQHLVVSGPDRW